MIKCTIRFRIGFYYAFLLTLTCKACVKSVQLSQQITLYKDFRILRIVFTFRWGILSRMWSDHWLPSISVNCSVIYNSYPMYFNSSWQVKDTTAFICLLNRDHYTNRNVTNCPGSTSNHLSCHFQYSETSTYIEHDSALKSKTSHVKVSVHHKLHWKNVKVFSKAQITVEKRKYIFLHTWTK